MYIAMNRFRIATAHERDFIEIWKNRDSYLGQTAGFRSFHLLRGEAGEGETIFISHSVWDSREAFKDWTESEHFKKAHAGARAPKGTYLSHPKFEGFEVILSE